MNPSQFLVQLDTIIIGIAITVGVDKITSSYSSLALLNVIAFFIIAINFYHGKLSSISDSEYQDYASTRDSYVEMGDFFFHIFTLGSLAFMPYFINNIIGYIFCNIGLRVADMALVGIVYLASSTAPLSKKKIASIRRTHRDWFIYDTFSLIVALVMLALVRIQGASWGVVASAIILFVAVLDIIQDYVLHSHHYFNKVI